MIDLGRQLPEGLGTFLPRSGDVSNDRICREPTMRLYPMAIGIGLSAFETSCGPDCTFVSLARGSDFPPRLSNPD
jgi:hypothetical protein